VSATRRISLLPRWVHHARAELMGYFWAPCPLCGRHFGGHEWRDRDGKPASIPDATEPGLAHGICPACTRAGRGIRSEGQ
jgi:hypothetical protein